MIAPGSIAKISFLPGSGTIVSADLNATITFSTSLVSGSIRSSALTSTITFTVQFITNPPVTTGTPTLEDNYAQIDATVAKSLAYSSNTPLLANAVLTIPLADSTEYLTFIRGFYSSDATGTLSLQRKINLSDSWTTVLTYTSGTGVRFFEGVMGKYQQLIYTNGGSNQTSFNIYVEVGSYVPVI